MSMVEDFWKRRWRRFLFLILFTLVSTLFALYFPYILKDIIDGIKVKFTTQRFLHSILILGIVGLWRNILGVSLPYMRGRTNETFFVEWRTGIFSKILKMGHSFTNYFPTGDIIQRLDSDLGELSWFSCSGIFRPIEGICTILFALFFLVRINFKLTIISILPMGLAIFAWMKFSPLIYKYYYKWREMISKTNDYLQTNFSGIKIVKSYTMEKQNTNQFRKLLDERIRSVIKVIETEAKIGTIFTSIEEIGILFILLFGGIFIIQNRLTIGEFVAFNAYILMLLRPMIDIGNFFVVKKRAEVQTRRLRDIIDFPTDVLDEGSNLLIDCKDICMTGVSFKYGKDFPMVLENINLKIPIGSKIGIAGTVAAGKTTIIKLLLRIAEPIEGMIRINNHDTRAISLKDFRKFFGYVPQEPSLFSETIYNNIVFGRKAQSTRIEDAVRLAQLENFLKTCPNGLNEKIGERGLKLSGGEKQRIAMARALLTEPRILILDDATSNLDAETEKEFMNQLSRESNSTVIIVSHRLSILSICDYIYVLDKARIVEEGNHKSLLKKKELYWKLYQHQLLSD